MTTPTTGTPRGVEQLLQRLSADPARAERLRLRCHAALARRQRRAERAARLTGAAGRLLAPAVIGGFCLLYVIALVIETFRVERLLR